MMRAFQKHEIGSNCDYRHHALRFVLIVTHTKSELRYLLSIESLDVQEVCTLRTTLVSYASACINQACDLYQYVTDLVDNRLKPWTAPLDHMTSDDLEEFLVSSWDSLTYKERAASIWILLGRGESARCNLQRVFSDQASLGLT